MTVTVSRDCSDLFTAQLFQLVAFNHLISRRLCDVVHDNGGCHPGTLAPLMFPAVTVSRDRSVLLIAELF